VAPDAEKIVSEALKLPAEERAELVNRLLRSLDDEEGDALDDLDCERLHAAITRSEEQFNSGQTIPSKTVLDRLRKPLTVKRSRVEFSPEAASHVEASPRGGSPTRPAAALLFADELRAAIRQRLFSAEIFASAKDIPAIGASLGSRYRGRRRRLTNPSSSATRAPWSVPPVLLQPP